MVDAITALGLLDDSAIALDRAALQIAALDHDGVDLSPYLDLLGRIETRLRSGSEKARPPAEVAERLRQVLAGEFGFEGDRNAYDHPANADMIRVIDRRRGLPIALVILYVALARRVGWTIHALNTPGHALAAVGTGAEVVLDPFNGGARVESSPEAILPMTNRAVLVRLMANEASRAEGAGLAARALTVLRRITTVAPGYSWGWWERARLERLSGDIEAARSSLSAMLETTRDEAVRKQVMTALSALG